MRRNLSIFYLLSVAFSAFSTTWTITNSGFAFSPATITIKQGDDVNFVLASIHNAVEVSQSTWNANGNSPIIGFTVPFGGGNVTAAELSVGTHYYVCEPHASGGMKGQIIVQSTSAVKDIKVQTGISVYPSTTIDQLNVQCNGSDNNFVEIKMFDMQGKLALILQEKTYFPGAYSKTFNIKGKIQSGVYFMQIIVGGKISVKKIVVL